jgi:hypothetical protein
MLQFENIIKNLFSEYLIILIGGLILIFWPNIMISCCKLYKWLNDVGFGVWQEQLSKLYSIILKDKKGLIKLGRITGVSLIVTYLVLAIFSP